MEHLKLSAQPREVTGKEVKRLRNEGIIPVVVYGGAVDGAVALQIDERDLNRVLGQSGTSTVIDLEVDGGDNYPVLPREVQRHPLRHTITHVDFLAVRMDRVIQANVALTLLGEPEIVTNNQAILVQAANNVSVEALPDALPSSLEVDVMSLEEIGDQLTATAIKLPEGVKLLTDEETVVALLTAPSRVPAVEVEEVEGIEGLEEGEDEALEDEDEAPVEGEEE